MVLNFFQRYHLFLFIVFFSTLLCSNIWLYQHTLNVTEPDHDELPLLLLCPLLYLLVPALGFSHLRLRDLFKGRIYVLYGEKRSRKYAFLEAGGNG